MITTATPRRRAGQRISSALWGVLVMGAGVMLAVALSGNDIDLELVAIIALAAIGGWLLLSATLSGIGRQKEVRAATAPVVEEPLADSRPPRDEVDDEPGEADPALGETEGRSDQPTTEVLFTDSTDSQNQNERRHAEETTASDDSDGVSPADPVQSAEANENDQQDPERRD